MEEPPQEEAASPFGRWFDGVFASLIALIGGAMVVTMYTGLDWSEPWWLTALITPLLVVVAGGLAWVLTCAILSALAAASRASQGGLEAGGPARRRPPGSNSHGTE